MPALPASHKTLGPLSGSGQLPSKGQSQASQGGALCHLCCGAAQDQWESPHSAGAEASLRSAGRTLGVSICHPGALRPASAQSPSAGTAELVGTPLRHLSPAPGRGRLAEVPGMSTSMLTFTDLAPSLPSPGDPWLLSHQTDIPSI